MQNTELQVIQAGNNCIKELNLSTQMKLTELQASCNKLTKIPDIPSPELKTLRLHGNLINNLD